jgi:hypothetical protein
MTFLWLPPLVARFGGKVIAGDRTIPQERRAHATAVLGAVGAFAGSVVAPIHNPWLYAWQGIFFGELALLALRKAQHWEQGQPCKQV